MFAEGGEHAIGLEALADQISIQSLEFLVIVDSRSTAQTTLERRRQERVGIDVFEYLLDRAVGDARSNAGGAKAAAHAGFAPSPHRRFPTCDHCRRSRVVDVSVGFQSSDRLVDLVAIVFASSEPLSDLGFRELSASEHLERREIRVGSHPTTLTGHVLGRALLFGPGVPGRV